MNILTYEHINVKNVLTHERMGYKHPQKIVFASSIPVTRGAVNPY